MGLLDLPLALLLHIAQQLSHPSLEQLRLVCSTLRGVGAQAVQIVIYYNFFVPSVAWDIFPNAIALFIKPSTLVPFRAWSAHAARLIEQLPDQVIEVYVYGVETRVNGNDEIRSRQKLLDSICRKAQQLQLLHLAAPQGPGFLAITEDQLSNVLGAAKHLQDLAVAVHHTDSSHGNHSRSWQHQLPTSITSLCLANLVTNTSSSFTPHMAVDLATLSQTIPKVNHLHLENIQLVNTASISTLCSLQQLTLLATPAAGGLASLQHLSTLTSLSSITAPCESCHTQQDWQTLASLPSLESLHLDSIIMDTEHLHHLHSATGITSLQLRNSTRAAEQMQPGCLMHLVPHLAHISCCNITLCALQHLLTGLHKLSSLHLSIINGFQHPNRPTPRPFTDITSLAYCQIDSVPASQVESIITQLSVCSKLQQLSIRELRRASARSSSALVRKVLQIVAAGACRDSLQVLEMPSSSPLSFDRDVVPVVKRLPALTELLVCASVPATGDVMKQQGRGKLLGRMRMGEVEVHTVDGDAVLQASVRCGRRVVSIASRLKD